MYLSIKELLNYTGEERERWDRWFLANGDELLAIPIAGERETTLGRLILHIFGPELRYVEMLRKERLTEYKNLPSSSVETVFGFGLTARQAMREYVASLGADDWARVVELALPGGRTIRASIRKVLSHVLIHEIRHWAQVARIVRERGFTPPGGHDLLMSDALE